MKNVPVLFLALVFTAACNSQPAPTVSNAAPAGGAPAPNASSPAGTMAAGDNEVQQKLQEMAGSGATDCGQVKSLSAEETKTASDCAMQSAKNKKAFRVSYSMPGMTVGIAGNAEGKLFTVQSEEENGKPIAPKAQPCPSELRVAQSGRVTCFPAGSMGVTPGSANPHATGMGAPAPGTPNPHKQGTAAPQKSH